MGIFKRLRRKAEQAKKNYRAYHLGRNECCVFTRGNVKEDVKVYRLAGNDWYAVAQDDDKVMLVDTDCKVAGEDLKTRWSNGDWESKEGENGQCILDYCNNLVDTYFNNIKHAINPRTVEAGAGKLENALMWPMSKEEFKEHKDISGKIIENSHSFVWTRTFSSIGSIGSSNGRCAWCLDGAGGDLDYNYSSVGYPFRVAPAFYLCKSSIDYITEDGEIVLKPVEQKGKFVTDGSKTYHLAGNDWYAVMQDDDKVMLVDTDCNIGGEELYTPWDDVDDGENGQCILDYVNRFTDTYFSTVKHAIMPRTVEAGTGKIEYAWMWPMSKEEFEANKAVGSKIACNSNGGVWTRTFGGVDSYNNYNLRYVWRVSSLSGDLSYTDGINFLCRVAPAFYLRKSAIDHITEDGKIVLNEGMTILKSQYDFDAELQRLREAGMDEAGIRQYQKYIEIFCKDH